jgi:hypothetical protein
MHLNFNFTQKMVFGTHTHVYMYIERDRERDRDRYIGMFLMGCVNFLLTEYPIFYSKATDVEGETRCLWPLFNKACSRQKGT